MEEVQIVNHLHKLIEDLQRLQQHSYPHALNNIAEQTRITQIDSENGATSVYVRTE